jgi:hypothetical protein
MPAYTDDGVLLKKILRHANLITANDEHWLVVSKDVFQLTKDELDVINELLEEA